MPKKPAITWTRHKIKWSTCVRCELSECRNHVVLARGKLPAEVLIVGEAPGASEDVLGRPFVGPAGKLLDSIIEEAEVVSCKPSKVFTNLVGCIPKDDGGNKAHEPPRDSLLACGPRLQELTEIARPKGIIMVGKLPQKWCPKLIDYDFEMSLDIVHPAAILRMDVSQQGLAIQRTTIQIRDFFNKLIPF